MRIEISGCWENNFVFFITMKLSRFTRSVEFDLVAVSRVVLFVDLLRSMHL